jgi:hypothetical protein
MTATTMKLHAALIWGGEPIADVILDKPGPITIGPVASTTFTTPDLAGLPDVFSIVRPGASGYLLTMGQAMTGTVSLGGVRNQVSDLVGDAAFAATPVAAGDWGVVDLDGTSGLQLFFQVAPAAEQVAPARGVDLETLLPAAAFSVLLHLMLLVFTFVVNTGESPVTWPGPRALTGNYLVTRIEPPTTPPPIKPALVMVPSPPSDEPIAPSQVTPPKQAPTTSAGRDGRKGSDRVKPDAPDQGGRVGLNTPENAALLRRLTNSPVDTTKWTRALGHGVGRHGIGAGAGHEELPAGHVDGTPDGNGFKRQGEIDTDNGRHETEGQCRRADRRTGRCGAGSGDAPPERLLPPPPDKIEVDNLDPREIQKRIWSRKGLFGACFQREFNRDPQLGGSLVTRFAIGPDGRVTSVAIESGIANANLRGCVKRNLTSIKFPTSDGGGVVRYPFIFKGGK